MDSDDLEPRKVKPKPKDLELLGVEELEEYIAGLQAEIDRARAVIDGKQSHKGAAEALFKPRG
ncbi:MAG: DUF1192 domain-containing protein [Limibacillus sp.]|jgi:uncharacterized small protein (DUF1192 family)